MMKNIPPEDTNELLVRLYALSHEQSIEHFQNAALSLLRPVVAFDAAIWGAATTGAAGIDIHSFHLNKKTPDMVASYEEVKHLDSASGGMFGKPTATKAFDTSSFFAERSKRPIRDFMALVSQGCEEDYRGATQLPPDLTTLLRRGKNVFIWHHLVVQCHSEHGLIIIQLREQTLVDSLTAREKEIALLVAKGSTHKQVAATLGSAPNTVRNQIQTLYSKLQINNIAELVRVMIAHE